MAILLALTGVGAAPVQGSVPTALCIPILMQCGHPAPAPSPTPTHTTPSIPGIPIPLPGGSGTPSSSPTPGAPATADPTPPPAVPDAGAPTFTLPPAQLGGSSISFSGLKSITVVEVPLADGSKTPALKLVADDIAIDDFTLNVRKATGPVLLTTADRMELRGDVQVYVDSVTATLPDGSPLTLGATTPPPQGGLPPQLLKVNLGLLGVTAGSISFKASHQALSE